jgi:hypothetical protein
MAHMDTRNDKQGDSWALAGLLAGRFGELALSRAAGKAAAAERSGNQAERAIWYGVLVHLRNTL